MSSGEILVVVMVALLVMKPDDIAVILEKFQQLKAYLTTIRSEILSYIERELQIDKGELNNLSELNFYLQKIISITGNYEGDYSLQQIKKKYNELIKEKINEDNHQK